MKSEQSSKSMYWQTIENNKLILWDFSWPSSLSSLFWSISSFILYKINLTNVGLLSLSLAGFLSFIIHCPKMKSTSAKYIIFYWAMSILFCGLGFVLLLNQSDHYYKFIFSYIIFFTFFYMYDQTISALFKIMCITSIVNAIIIYYLIGFNTVIFSSLFFYYLLNYLKEKYINDLFKKVRFDNYLNFFLHLMITYAIYFISTSK